MVKTEPLIGSNDVASPTYALSPTHNRLHLFIFMTTSEPTAAQAPPSGVCICMCVCDFAHFSSHNTDIMTDDILSAQILRKLSVRPSLTPTPMPACRSEQTAARVLGYTPVSWDDLSGGETQPWSSIKAWAALTEEEKAAAAVLGYMRPTWDNRTRFAPKPVSAMKMWSELSSCADGETTVPRVC